jgi:hypothetical protein
MQIKQVCAFNSQINLDRAEEHAKKIMWTFFQRSEGFELRKTKDHLEWQDYETATGKN